MATKAQAKTVMKRAFAETSDANSLVDGRLLGRVRDCILDYVPAARERGLNYTPVIFGLKRADKGGMTLMACSEQIRRLEPDGLVLNGDSYPSIEALMIAAELNRIFEEVQKDL